MVLILSEEDDVSTDYAVEWFRYHHIPFVRLNDRTDFNILHSIEFRGNEPQVMLRIKGRLLNLEDITGVWFRRGFIQFSNDFAQVSQQSSSVTEQMLRLLRQENQTMTEYLVHCLLEKRSLNSQYCYNANKLTTLLYAGRAGLDIPHSLVTDTLSTVHGRLHADPEQLIAKPVQDIFALRTGNTVQSQYTEVLSAYPALPEKFYYTMFQEKIRKKYELRIFFIKNDFYPCAIFSNATDGRDLQAGGIQTRIVPFRLPEDIQNKLVKLNDMLGLDCGSIDMLVDQQQQYYFLEVNPVGQYDYVSKAGNYYLDEKIAQYFAYDSPAFRSA